MSSKIKKATKKKASTIIVVEEQEAREPPIAETPVEEPPTYTNDRDDTIYKDAMSAEDRAMAARHIEVVQQQSTTLIESNQKVEYERNDVHPAQVRSALEQQPLSQSASTHKEAEPQQAAVPIVATAQPIVPTIILNAIAEPVSVVETELEQPVAVLPMQKKATKTKKSPVESKTIKKKKPASTLIMQVTSQQPIEQPYDQAANLGREVALEERSERQRLIEEEEKLLKEQYEKAQPAQQPRNISKEAIKEVDVPSPEIHPPVVEKTDPPAVQQLPTSSATIPTDQSIIDRLKPAMSDTTLVETTSTTLPNPQESTQKEQRLEASLKELVEQRLQPAPVQQVVAQPPVEAVQYDSAMQAEVVEEVVVISKTQKKKPVDTKKTAKKSKQKEIKIESAAVEVEIPPIEQQAISIDQRQEVSHQLRPQAIQQNIETIRSDKPTLAESAVELTKQPEIQVNDPLIESKPEAPQFQQITHETNQSGESKAQIIQKPVQPTHTNSEHMIEGATEEHRQAILQAPIEVLEVTFAVKPKKKGAKQEKKQPKSKPTQRKTESVTVQQITSTPEPHVEAKRQDSVAPLPMRKPPDQLPAAHKTEHTQINNPSQPPKQQALQTSPIQQPKLPDPLPTVPQPQQSTPEVKSEKVFEKNEEIVVEQPQQSKESLIDTKPTPKDSDQQQVPSKITQVPPQLVVEELTVDFAYQTKKQKKEPVSKANKDFKKKKPFASVELAEENNTGNLSHPAQSAMPIKPIRQEQPINIRSTEIQSTMSVVIEKSTSPREKQTLPEARKSADTAQQQPMNRTSQVGLSTFLSKLQLKPCFSDKQNQMRQTVCMIKEDILSRLANRTAPAPTYRADETYPIVQFSVDQFLEENVQRHRQYRAAYGSSPPPALAQLGSKRH